VSKQGVDQSQAMKDRHQGMADADMAAQLARMVDVLLTDRFRCGGHRCWQAPSGPPNTAMIALPVQPLCCALLQNCPFPSRTAGCGVCSCLIASDMGIASLWQHVLRCCHIKFCSHGNYRLELAGVAAGIAPSRAAVAGPCDWALQPVQATIHLRRSRLQVSGSDSRSSCPTHIHMEPQRHCPIPLLHIERFQWGTISENPLPPADERSWLLRQGDERLTGVTADVRLEPLAMALSRRAIALLRTCLTFEQQRRPPSGSKAQQQRQQAELPTAGVSPKAGASPRAGGGGAGLRPPPPEEPVPVAVLDVLAKGLDIRCDRASVVSILVFLVILVFLSHRLLLL